MSLTGRFKEVFVERAIDLDLAAVRHRPYVDLEDVFQADPNYRDLESGQLRFLERMMEQSDGIVMVRHAPPLKGIALPPIFAELRPLDPVLTGRRRHNFVDKNGKLWDHHIGPELRTEGWRKHVTRGEQEDDHHGQNNADDHYHMNLAKYLFPPGVNREVPWENHDHMVMPAEKLAAHLVKYDHPDGADTTHVKSVKDARVNRAKRIDVHPWGVERFGDAEVVYFALEGCLKADAILTAIIHTRERASVFSAPSVTLWDAKEFSRFVKQYLRGKLVIIVPDADWRDERKGGGILAQALYCREALREMGGLTGALIAAPPMCLGEKKTKGIDDFLAAGGKLGDLKVIDRQTPVQIFSEWQSPASTVDGRSRDGWVLKFLSLHAAEGTRQYSAPLLTIAKRVVRRGMHSATIKEALLNLVEGGAVTSDKPLVTTSKQWIAWPSHNPYGSGGWTIEHENEDFWCEIPTFTIDPRYEATTDETQTVEEMVEQARAGHPVDRGLSQRHKADTLLQAF
jgi:hypothetical protein